MLRTLSWQVWLLLTCCLLACNRAQGVPTQAPPEASTAPLQTPEPADLPPVIIKYPDQTWSLFKLAHYRISARVLSRERYFWGKIAKLSPIDLALGWGSMANPKVDEYIDWSQGGRWYYFQYSNDSPYLLEDIRTQSANVHIVPATLNLRRALMSLRRNDQVLLDGSLIRVIDASGTGEPWQSSVSRSDVGGGACEVMYVESLVHSGIEYH